ncbi:hypothetical protein ACTFIW_003893 [Dictyostelium discoideum]
MKVVSPKSKILNKTYIISQYHHLEGYDIPVNKDSLYTLYSFYNQNIVTQLYQQSQQHDVHKNIPEGPKSDYITKEVQNLLLDDVIEQVLPNRYSKRVFTPTCLY